MRWVDSLALLREHGPGWVIRRAAWEIALRGGLLARRLPARPAPGAPERRPPHWLPGGTPEALQATLQAPLQEGDRLRLLRKVGE